MSRTAATFLSLVCAGTLLVLVATALAGPWILDDQVNFLRLVHWLNGEANWQAALFDNASGPLRRPLAYLSFLVNASVSGFSPVGFKLVNIGFHLACGLLVFLLLNALLLRVYAATFARTVALAVALLWLLLPLHVSTVLYPVQRMTLLSTFFSLLALLVFVRARSTSESDPSQARQLLFLAFPLFCLLSVLSKENGVLTPLFALLAEVCFMTRRSPKARRQVLAFFTLFLFLPLVAGLAAFASNPARWLNYSGREFDLADRLITQPVVLLEYLRAILLPLPQWLHLYREGHSIASLWAGLAAGTFWLFWTATGLWLIRRKPLVAFGLLLFVSGHLIESTVLPLELYFEHRNYLPSAGVVMVLVGLMMRSGSISPFEQGQGEPRPDHAQPERGPTLPAVISLVVVASIFAAAMAHRAWQWRDLDRLLAAEGPAPPEISRRHQVDRAIRGFETGNFGMTEGALALLDAGNAGDRAAAAQWRVVFTCERDGSVSEELLQALHQVAPPVITHNHVSYMQLLGRRVEGRFCKGLDAQRLIPVLEHWINSSRQVSHVYGPRQLSLQQAQMHLLAGAPAKALAALPDPGRDDFRARTLRIQVLIALGRMHEARDLIRRAQTADRGWYRSRTQILAELAVQAR